MGKKKGFRLIKKYDTIENEKIMKKVKTPKEEILHNEIEEI